MKWYEQKYVNHRDWILDHLEFLGLSSDETIIVLLIDFMNQNHEEITMEALRRKTGQSMDELDRVISVLCAKKYLEIKASSRQVRFLLDGLFETDTARDEKIMDASLFDAFESELARPLSSKEMERISEWNRTTDKKLILYALREASAYQKLSLNYIERILNEWKAKGVTAESIVRSS